MYLSHILIVYVNKQNEPIHASVQGFVKWGVNHKRINFLQVSNDVAEDIADGWAQDYENDDHDNRNQNKN
jgi:hypothetical protein